MRRSDEFWKGAREAQRTLAFLVAVVIVLGLKESSYVGHVPIVFGTLGSFLGVVYVGRAYVDGKERDPDLHRALGERQALTGQNPTPPRDPA